MGRGWTTKGRGGGEFSLPHEKRGAGADKVLAMLKGGGHNKFWVSFYAVA